MQGLKQLEEVPKCLFHRGHTHSFANDMLIAASARDLGAAILTDNGEDFGIISSVLDIRYVAPWPEDAAARPPSARPTH